MEFKYNDYKETGIDLLSKLISYASVLEEYDPNSTEPFGLENKEVLDFILNHAKNDGFEVVCEHRDFDTEGEKWKDPIQ